MTSPAAAQELTFAGVTVDDGIGTITIARPEARNALSTQVASDLADAVAFVAEEPSVRAVILTAEGTVFSSGGDIKEIDSNRPAYAQREHVLKLLDGVATPLARIPKPTIAAVQGHAHGAGLSLMLCCDISVVSEEATFSMAFVRVGLVPDYLAMYFLPRVVGLNKAKELTFTGAQLTAAEAKEIGLVNRVVPADSVLAEATALARELANGPSIAHALAKRLLDQSLHVSLEDLAQIEALAQSVCLSTPEHVEGANAFLERRPAQMQSVSRYRQDGEPG